MILWAFVFIMLGIMSVLLIAVTVFLIRVMKDVTKDMPKAEIPNPIKAAKEQKAQKNAKMEQDIYETIMRNIDNYDGTDSNQYDVPGR